MVESSTAENNSPPELLYALCCKLLGKDSKSQGIKVEK